jgi:hypothetical protein
LAIARSNVYVVYIPDCWGTFNIAKRLVRAQHRVNQLAASTYGRGDEFHHRSPGTDSPDRLPPTIKPHNPHIPNLPIEKLKVKARDFRYYELIKDGQIETIKVGTATLVPIDSLRRFLDGLRSKQPPFLA